MSAATLFVGGPLDGEIRVVQDPRLPIRVARPSVVPASYLAEDVSPLAEIPLATETYEGEVLSFFGVPLQVHLHESLAYGRASRSRLALALATHLLTDKGKAVVRA